MSSILQISNFKSPGRFHLSLNGNNEDGLQAYIDEVQGDILNKLLGCDLAKLFVADLTGTPQRPQDQIYKDIFEPFCVEEMYCGQLTSKGMLIMLQGFTFWYYFRDNGFKRTTSGPKKNAAENSEDVPFSSMGFSTFWNRAEDTFTAIQRFIIDKPEVYPTFKGVLLGTVSTF